MKGHSGCCDCGGYVNFRVFLLLKFGGGEQTRGDFFPFGMQRPKPLRIIVFGIRSLAPDYFFSAPRILYFTPPEVLYLGGFFSTGVS